MKSMMIFAISLLALAFFLFGSYQVTAAATATVNVGPGIAFSPANVTVTQGDTVSWVWLGGFHSTTSGSCPGGICTTSGIWNSGIQSPPFNFGFTFNTPGTFPYFCQVHGAAMQGTITVNARPAEVPEADSLVLLLSGGAGLASFLRLKWRARKRVV